MMGTRALVLGVNPSSWGVGDVFDYERQYFPIDVSGSMAIEEAPAIAPTIEGHAPRNRHERRVAAKHRRRA